MSEIFLKLFSFWGGTQLLYLMGSLAAFWVVLYGWLFLWHKTWAAEHKGKVLMLALIPTLPMLWANHAAMSAEILQKSPRILEQRVERQMPQVVENFCSRFASKCGGAEQFKKRAIPEYAAMLMSENPTQYFPMETTADYVASDPEVNKFLSYVYKMRNSAESPFGDERDLNLWHKMVSEYMAQQQFEQNKAKLEQMAAYSPYGWFALLLAIAMGICARLAYKDINERCCYPYRKR